ncbi:Hypothetical predicted protein [Octopus vulgaris]|uniref:Uncharacterized protein n=1 Tax=Octopus vulgaris TaxID=6645 RepID=A0AA36B507_OCTVU|nr:Hypothetical predicted protein [Octopus vulgaris]
MQVVIYKNIAALSLSLAVTDKFYHRLNYNRNSLNICPLLSTIVSKKLLMVVIDVIGQFSDKAGVLNDILRDIVDIRILSPIISIYRCLSTPSHKRKEHHSISYEDYKSSPDSHWLCGGIIIFYNGLYA